MTTNLSLLIEEHQREIRGLIDAVHAKGGAMSENEARQFISDLIQCARSEGFDIGSPEHFDAASVVALTDRFAEQIRAREAAEQAHYGHDKLAGLLTEEWHLAVAEQQIEVETI